jgi:hypothetical protein
MPLNLGQFQQLSNAQTQRQQQQPANAPRPQQEQQPTAPDPATWNYKTSPVNLKGETLPTGAQSWTPFGQPYFGQGLGGTLKKYAWSLMGSPTQGAEEDRWAKFNQLTQSAGFWGNPLSKEFGDAAKTFGQGLTGASATKEQDQAQIKQANARLKQLTDQYGDNVEAMPSSVQKEYQELQSFWNSPGAAFNKIESAASGSLLTPLLRGSKVGMQALMDVLSEASIKVEQGLGAQSAMRDYANENSDLPDFAADIDRTSEAKSEAWQNSANIASRILAPALGAWDTFRFWTAPGTTKQKQQVLQEGYDAGRILYSQAIKPALLEEWKRRAAAGEDPQLLAMELQDPWAEAIGQFGLDPLNFVGFAAKGAKTIGMLDDATDLVRGGSLGDEAVNLMTDAGKTMAGPLGETRAAERMGKFDELVTNNIKRLEDTRLTPDYNKATAYSPTGLRVRETKVVQTTSAVVTSSIMRNGGSADDVADFMSDLSKATGADKANRMEAWDRIMTMSQRYGLGRYAFSDDVLETGVLLRNLTEDKDLLTVLKAGKGDLAETAKILDRTFQRAVEKQIPTYSDVKKGAEAFKAGTDTSKQAEKLAGVYEGIKNKVLWNLHEGKLGDFKTAVNSFLGKFFFAQPGFVVRNASNNLMTMFVDQGLSGTAKGFYRDGKFWSVADIDADLMKYFGGKLPPATQGISLTKSQNAETVVSKLNDAVESGFAKRIYWKQFRDTMDKFLTPGVALPKRDEFKAIGMTDEGIDHFLHVLKNESYGNVEQAIVKYSEKYGDNGLLDTWKRWNGSVSGDEMKGLTELGLTKEIDEIVSTAKTPQEIKSRIAALKKELTTRANSATDNPVGVNRERKGFEFMDTLGKAEKDGLLDVDGTNRLNVLIEQSEKASDELMQALGKARNVVADPATRQEFSIMEEAFSATRRGTARQTSQQATETAWQLTKRSRTSTGLQVEQMWNESILAKQGPPPAGLTADDFRTQLWQATRNEVSNTWEMYFSEGFDKLTPLIDNLTESFPELAGIFKKSQRASAELNMYRTAAYRDGKIYYSQPPTNIRELANRYNIPTASAEGVPNDKQLLNTINKYTGQKYKTLDEIPLDDAEKALQTRGAQKGSEIPAEGAETATDELGAISQPQPNPEVQISPPYVDGSTPIPGQMWKENSDGIIAALNKVERHMLDNYGLKAVEKLDGSQLKALKGMMKDASGRTTEAIAIADKIGKEWRDFALLPYGETKNFDLALSYAFPYQFWYSRSYNNWMKRVATDPQVIANYARIKEAMSRVNKDSPEWWRYNVEIPSHFLGLPNEHPMSFNLEANIWPLYGLTGTDFNDPQKRTNWFTSTVDDIGKFGPSVWSPIQWAIALYYRTQGENEVAASWAGRMIPQTNVAKAVSHHLFGKPIELDPMIQIFSGEGLGDLSAMDKWERRKVGRVLMTMTQNDELTQEQAIEVARTQEGPVWDEAVLRATKLRETGAVMSWLAGVGLKPRTKEDMVTDEFYQEYYRLQNLNEADLISPDKYQEGWDALREKYPFMDALLLSRKAGPDRDKAYAYNVLGRIPPGQASDLYKAAGINPDTARKFYDSKGNMAGWSDSEKERFMSAMVDLGATLAIPETATKQSWRAARGDYQDMKDMVIAEFGDDIYDKRDYYFSLEGAEKDAYKAMHPEIEEARQLENEFLVNNPLLYEYYGGMETLEQYYNGKVYDELEQKFGDLQPIFDRYYELNLTDPKAARKFKKIHPEMDAYSKYKNGLQQDALAQMLKFSTRLPDGPELDLRGDFDEEAANPAQQNISGYSAQRTPSPQEFQQALGAPLYNILQEYYANLTFDPSKARLPYQAENELEYKSKRLGYDNSDDLLRDVLLSMQQ